MAERGKQKAPNSRARLIALRRSKAVLLKMWLGKVWSEGIDWSLPGNGGPECAAYLSPQRQVFEFITGITLALIALLTGASLHQGPSLNLPSLSSKTQKNGLAIPYTLLVLMTATYVAEVGYKIYSHQAIFIFNPCHCLCLVQMFILYRLCRASQSNQDLALVYTFR